MKNHIACFYDLSPPPKKDVVNPQVTAATCPHLPGHIHIIHHMPKLKGAKGTAKHSKIRSAIKSNRFQSICCLLVIPQNINLENPFPKKKRKAKLGRQTHGRFTRAASATLLRLRAAAGGGAILHHRGQGSRRLVQQTMDLTVRTISLGSQRLFFWEKIDGTIGEVV